MRVESVKYAALSVLLLVVLTFSSTSFVHAQNQTFDRDTLTELVDESRYEEAIELARRLRVEAQAVHGEDSLEESLILDSLVEALYRSGHAMEDETVELVRRAIALKESNLGEYDTGVVPSLTQAGNLYIYRNENPEARGHYERGLSILETTGEQASPVYGLLLNNIGVTFRRAGEYDQALAVYRRGLQLREQMLGPDHPDVAESLNNIANLYVQLGDYAGSTESHRRALAIRENHYGAEHEWVAESLNNLASSLGYAGIFDEALAVQERCVAIFAAGLGTDHESYWAARFNLAVLYNDMGDYRGAWPIFTQVLEAQQQRFGEDNPTTIEALDVVAECHVHLGEYELGEALFRKSLGISEREFGVDNIESVYTIQGLGECLAESGRSAEAAEYFSRALAIWEAEHEPDSPELCDLLHLLAESRLRDGDFVEAARLTQRSARIVAEKISPGHPLLAKALRLSAEAALGEGDSDRALNMALRAEAISRAHSRATMRVLSESLALDYGASRVTGLDLALDIAASGVSGKAASSVFDAVIKSRGLVFDEMAARTSSLSDSDDAGVRDLVQRTRLARERLAHLGLRGPGWEEISAYRAMILKAQEEKDAADRALALASERFRDQENLSALGLADVRAALASTDRLVAFARRSADGGSSDSKEQYLALILSPHEQHPRIVCLGDANEVDSRVGAWREQAAWGAGRSDRVAASRGFLKRSRQAVAQLEDYGEAARALRHSIWDPLISHLGSAQRVFVVPDGSLHLVNFYSLLDDEGRYLVETGPAIHLLPTERSLCRPLGSGSSAGGLLAVGNPSYDLDAMSRATAADPATDADCASLSNLRFSDLAGAEAEAGEILELWQQLKLETPTLLAASQATVGQFKQSLGGQRVLHLATHGFFLPSICPEDEEGALLRENPLLRSGLAFAGANDGLLAEDHGEDGLLTAEEVAALDLNGVQWAVLSACDTGLGDLRGGGEGVFGLARAFQIAGAASVIMSLWQVDDESTRAWMQSLYQARFGEGATTGDAVRMAAMSSLRRLRQEGVSDHPYYWAGFVALGDWR